MKKIIGYIAGLIVVAMISFFIGYQVSDLNKKNIQSFYATIIDIRGDAFTVSGSELNDVNHRGEFSFGVEKDTKITCEDVKIKSSDLSVGDGLCVTYKGGVRESAPAQIDVIKLELLEE